MLQKAKLFFSQIKEAKIWKKPSRQLEVKTNICKICFSPIEDDSFHNLFYPGPTICHRCFSKFSPRFLKFKVANCKALSIFDYDDLIKEKLYQFKGCSDYELKSIFLEYFANFLKLKYHGFLLVPAPSHITSDEKRGFNHVVEMFSLLHLKMISCIHKIDDVKQSDCSAKEREEIIKHLKIDENAPLKNKKILIVDDVYTTGSTVKAMIRLINRYKPKKIEVLVMSKTKGI